MEGEFSYILLIVPLVPVSNLHQTPNITPLFDLTSSMELITAKKICVKSQTQNNELYHLIRHERVGKFVSWAIHISRGKTRITFQQLCTTRFEYTIKYRAFLHLVHTPMYNSMHQKQNCFPLILYICAQTYYAYTSTTTKKTTRHPWYTPTHSYDSTYNDPSAHTCTQNPAWRPSYTSTSSYNYTYKYTCAPGFHSHQKIIYKQKPPQYTNLPRLHQNFTKVLGWDNVPGNKWRPNMNPGIRNVQFLYTKKYYVSGYGSPVQETCAWKR